MAFALAGARVFDGESIRGGIAVAIESGRITEVAPEEQLATGIERRVLNGGFLVPGFIDVQVNGGGGALLNDNPTINTVKSAGCLTMAYRGVDSMLDSIRAVEASDPVCANICALNQPTKHCSRIAELDTQLTSDPGRRVKANGGWRRGRPSNIRFPTFARGRRRLI